MLKSLFIRNFALIREAQLAFDQGYTVITGETGSGKSILLNALQLILGERADFKVIGTDGDKAVVEAEFELEQGRFDVFFKENDIDSEAITIVRREISAQGRSRAFINDTPVQLTVLKTFTENLVTIHSQYNTLDLKRKDFQLQTLDVLAGTVALRKQNEAVYAAYKTLRSHLSDLREQLANELRDKDYNDFQLAELKELRLDETKFEALEAELNKAEHADELRSGLGSIDTELSGDQGILDRLTQLKQSFTRLSRLDHLFTEMEGRVQSAWIDLKDIHDTVAAYGQEMEVDPERRLALSAQLDAFNRLLLKHKCADQAELQQLLNQLDQKALDTESLEQTIAKTENELAEKRAELETVANTLHARRLDAVAGIEQRMSELLGDLKLPDTRLNVELSVLEKIGSTGSTGIQLLFSANKGIAPIPIEQAASGGELSRVMLALQKLVSEKQQLPTIFFDEIDTGVSGDVAQKVGMLLQTMGQETQLVAISHLPQVAAKAQHHLKVEKRVEGDRTQTQIVRLTDNQRVEEVARLMSGEEINEAAISNAKALMQ